MNGKIIIFDYWADFGLFKKYYTTSSPMAFINIPKTSLLGIIGAIGGYKKEEYLEKINQLKPLYSIKLKNKIRKMHIPENYIDTKASGSSRMCKFWVSTQINLEVTRSPEYRIYLYFANDINNVFEEKLESMLKEHKTFYQPCMGITEFLANFKFIAATKDFVKIEENKEMVAITGFCPTAAIKALSDIDFGEEENRIYSKEKIPLEIDKNRVVSRYEEIFFETSGKTLKIAPSSYFSIKYFENDKAKQENVILI